MDNFYILIKGYPNKKMLKRGLLLAVVSILVIFGFASVNAENQN